MRLTSASREWPYHFVIIHYIGVGKFQSMAVACFDLLRGFTQLSAQFGNFERTHSFAVHRSRSYIIEIYHITTPSASLYFLADHEYIPKEFSTRIALLPSVIMNPASFLNWLFSRTFGVPFSQLLSSYFVSLNCFSLIPHNIPHSQ